MNGVWLLLGFVESPLWTQGNGQGSDEAQLFMLGWELIDPPDPL